MSKTMTMPLSGKIIEVVYNNQIEIIWQGGHLQPTYSYRWEVDGDERIGREAAVTDTAGGPAGTGEGAAFSPGAQVAS